MPLYCVFRSKLKHFTDEESPFSYKEGTTNGPEHWGEINPHWGDCNNGKFQSPIDLGFVQIAPNLGKLRRNYKSAPASVKNRGHDIAVSTSISFLS